MTIPTDICVFAKRTIQTIFLYTAHLQTLLSVYEKRHGHAQLRKQHSEAHLENVIIQNITKRFHLLKLKNTKVYDVRYMFNRNASFPC